MATKPMRGGTTAASPTIPVRQITGEDLRWSLVRGLDDFLAMRGDLVFAGLIYTLIGIAAVVMTANMPLMPFFFPVVGGVGLLGPVAAVGFYQLARRREDGHATDNWFHFFDVLKRPAADDMGIVAGLLLLIFLGWLLAAGRALWRAVRPVDAALDHRLPRGGLHHAQGLGSDRGRRTGRRSVRLAGPRAQRRLAAAAGRLRCRRVRSALRLVAGGTCEQAHDVPLGADRRRAC